MKLRSPLFIGTGGGNDIFSTMLAVTCLRELGWEWDDYAIAGVLSPFHRHTVADLKLEGGWITLPTSRRFLNRRTEKPEIRFIDAQVAQMTRQKSYGFPSVFGLSLENGSEGLTRTFADLRRWHDYFVLVDVGGDILYRGPQDTHVLSPFFDATVLRAFIDSGAPGILFQAGPGTDGELEPESLRESLERYEAKTYPISPASVEQWEADYKTWIEPHRPGRTVPMTIQAYRSPDKVLTVPWHARAHMGATRKYARFEQRIDTELCRNFYLIEPHTIQNPLAMRCESPLDWFQKTQIQQHTNNEANLEYFMRYKWLTQLLTPSPLLSQADRQELISQGLDELNAGISDAVFMLASDRPALESHPANKKFDLAEWPNMLHILRAP